MSVCAILIPILLSYTQENSNSNDLGEVYKVDMVNVSYNGKSEVKKLPYNYDGSGTFYVYIDLKAIKGNAIGISSYYLNYEVFVDNVLIYKHYIDDNLHYVPKSGVPASYTIIDLPVYKKEREIKIKFKPRLRLEHDGQIECIDVADRGSFTFNFLKRDLIGIIVSVILYFFSICTLIGYYLNTKNKAIRKKIYALGITALIIATYYMTNTRIMIYAFSEYVGLMYILEYTSFLFSPYPLIKLVEDDVDEIYKLLMYFMKNILTINYLGQLFITVTRKMEFKEMLIISHVILFTSFIMVIVAVLSSNYKKKDYKMNLILWITPVYISIMSLFVSYYMARDYRIEAIFIISILFFVISQVFLLIKNYATMERENLNVDTYKRISGTDFLTGLGNRQKFELDLDEIRKDKSTFTVFMVDLNNLKLINDSLGHKAGDKSIIACGKFLKDNIPNSKVYRIGGDEFVVLMYGGNPDDIMKNIKNKSIYVLEVSDKIDVYFSIGKCTYDPTSMDDIIDAIKIADEEMYTNKREMKGILL